MSVYNQFFNTGGGPHTSNPKQLTRIQALTAIMGWQPYGATMLASDTTNFWTAMTASVNTAWTADTYKTLVTVASGSGFVSCIVGPFSALSTVTTFRIEVDGVFTDIAVTRSASAGGRVAVGRFRPFDSPTNTNVYSPFGDGTPSGSVVASSPLQWGSVTGSGALCLTPLQCHAYGVGMLRYETSMSIQAKNSTALSVNSHDAKIGVFYTVE